MVVSIGSKPQSITSFDWHDGHLEGIVQYGSCYAYFFLVGNPFESPRCYTLSDELPLQRVQHLIDKLAEAGHLGKRSARSVVFSEDETRLQADVVRLASELRGLAHGIVSVIAADDIEFEVKAVAQVRSEAEREHFEQDFRNARYGSMWRDLFPDLT